MVTEKEETRRDVERPQPWNEGVPLYTKFSTSKNRWSARQTLWRTTLLVVLEESLTIVDKLAGVGGSLSRGKKGECAG